MPDWRGSKLEDNVRDKLLQNGSGVLQYHDHDLEDPAVLGVHNKKLKHAVDLGKTTDSATPDIRSSDLPNFPSYNRDKSVVQLQYSGDCVPARSIVSDFAIPGEDTYPMRRDAVNDNSSCQFTHETSQNGLNLLETNVTYAESDLAYYDWPSIDNFEDVDNLFSKCDSTFGDRQIENTDELPWFPSSSDSFYTPDIAEQSDMPSAYADLDVLNDLAPYDCANGNLLAESKPSEAECDHSLLNDYFFEADVSARCVDHVPEGVKVELTATDQISSPFGIIGYDNCDLQISDHNLPAGSVYEQNSSQILSEEPIIMPSTVLSNASSDVIPGKNEKLVKVESCLTMSKNLLPDDEVKVRNVVARDAVTVNYPPRHARKSRSSISGIESSMVIDSSLASSLSFEEPSLQETSFRQLQDAMNQLDVNTKLCIRDGLYRLARSVRQRHTFPSEKDCTMGHGDTKETFDNAAPARFVGPITVETDTNPIDRSIALLLFHQPSEQAPGGAADDASSAKSRGTDEHSRVLVDSQEVQLVHSGSQASSGNPRNMKPINSGATL